jgi:C-terminal processing protease CtpA/Prc
MTIPVSNYVTWEGKAFEHTAVTPDIGACFDPQKIKAGRDSQLEGAISALS